MGPGLHLLEEEEVNAHSCIKQQWWQEDIQEELVWLYAKPPGNRVSQAAHTAICWEHEGLKDAT